MKTLCLALFALVSTPAFAGVSNFGIVKSQDGKIVVCQSAADLDRAGYRPLVTSMTSDGVNLKLSTAVVALVCANQNGQFDFDARKLADPIHGKDIYGNPTIEQVDQLRFLVIDRSFMPMGQLPAQNDMMQSINMEFPVAQSFSRADLDRLDRGETLKVRWEFFLQGTHAIGRVGQPAMQLGLFTGGSYYLNFDLSKQGGNFRVDNFRVR